MMIGIQVIGVLFALLMLYYSFLQYKRKEFTTREFTFWSVLWILFIYVTMFPLSLNFIVEGLSLSRPLDFFIIMGFMLIISMFFYTYTLVRLNQRKLEHIVRQMAKNKK